MLQPVADIIIVKESNNAMADMIEEEDNHDIQLLFTSLD